MCSHNLHPLIVPQIISILPHVLKPLPSSVHQEHLRAFSNVHLSFVHLSFISMALRGVYFTWPADPRSTFTLPYHPQWGGNWRELPGHRWDTRWVWVDAL